MHCDTLIDCVTRALPSLPWQALRKEKPSYLPVTVLFRDLLVVYTFKTHPCSFPFVVYVEFGNLLERNIHRCLKSKIILINRRHAILDAASIKNNPRLQCRCSHTPNTCQ